MTIARIEPRPSDEEAAAIEAALRELARKAPEQHPKRSVWVEAARREAVDTGV